LTAADRKEETVLKEENDKYPSKEEDEDEMRKQPQFVDCLLRIFIFVYLVEMMNIFRSFSWDLQKKTLSFHLQW
jgi:hypothetical protein